MSLCLYYNEILAYIKLTVNSGFGRKIKLIAQKAAVKLKCSADYIGKESKHPSHDNLKPEIYRKGEPSGKGEKIVPLAV